MDDTQNYETNSHMFLSVMCNLFCFSPFSVVGLVYSMKCENLLKRRELDTAEDVADTAKMWDTIGIVFGITVYIVGYILLILNAGLE